MDFAALFAHSVTADADTTKLSADLDTAAAALVEEPLALVPLAAEEGDGAAVTVRLPHHGVTRARITLTYG